ncbi:MAG: hypothetical protein AABZ58_02530, partial [Chloroflexota bacterium]
MDSTRPALQPLKLTQRSSQLDQRKIQIALTALTAIFIAASLIGESRNADPRLILAFNILSYVCGGWFGVQKAVGNLFEGKFNVDLLMIASAIGAAIIDQWR